MKYSFLSYYKSFTAAEGVKIGTLIEDGFGLNFIHTESALRDIQEYDPDVHLEFIRKTLIGMEKEVDNLDQSIEKYVEKYVNELRFGEIIEIKPEA